MTPYRANHRLVAASPLFFIVVFLSLCSCLNISRADARQTSILQDLERYRRCFPSVDEFEEYKKTALRYDALKKVENVNVGPYKVHELVRDDPLSDALCDKLPSFLKAICWGRTLAKYADELRKKGLNKEITGKYIRYLKDQTENCVQKLPIEPPEPIFYRLPRLGNRQDKDVIAVFTKGARAYCRELRQTKKKLLDLKKDCVPVPAITGMTYGKARNYLWGQPPDGLPEGKRFPLDLLVLENGRKRRVRLDSQAYRKIEQLKIVRQDPAAGVMVDRFLVNLAVALEPLVPQKVTIRSSSGQVIAKGAPLQLEAEVYLNNGERNTVTAAPECKWISSDSKVIRVDKGKVELLSPPAGGKQYQVTATYTRNGKTVKSDPYVLKIVVGKIPVRLIFKATGPRVFVTNQSGPQYQLWLRYSDGSSGRLDPNMAGFNKIAGFEVVPSAISVWAFGDELMASFPPNPTGSRFKVRAAYRKGKILLKSNWLYFRLKSGLLIVPDVGGKPVSEAVRVLKQAGFSSWSLSRYPCLGNEPPGHVVGQSPHAGWSATPGTTIDLLVEGVRVPDVIGKTEQDARGAIESVLLRFDPVQGLRFNPAYKPGQVSRQNPAAGSCVKPKTMIVATLNGAPVSATIPNLVGKTREAAEKIVAGSIFRLKFAAAKRHDRQRDVGVILRQTPAPGTSTGPNTANVITVYLNPALPQIGIHADPDRRSYPLGQEIEFTEDVKGKNTSNTYSFQWFVDGKAVARGGFLSYPFTTPGRHYVQLVMTSSDPQENDAMIMNIGIEYPPEPEVSVWVSPPAEKYPPGTRVTFICRSENLPDASAYNWYVDGKFVGKGQRLPYTLGGEGRYTVSVGVRRCSNFNEIKAEKLVEVGPPAIKPLGRWVNKFQPTGPATNLKVCSSYWIPGFSYSKGIGPMVTQQSGWSKCSAFDTVGKVDGYSLYTGEQADGHNSGWIAFAPAGTGRIRFKVYGFKFGDPVKDYHAQRGFVRYTGSIDPRGTLLPSSLSFIEKHARFGVVQWQTEEGLTCSARIHKFRKSGQGGITAHVLVPGGVDQENCVEGGQGADAAPANASGAAPPSFTNAIQAGNAFQHSLADDAGNQPGGGSQKASKGNLQNVSVSQRNVTLTFWDHGKEDGDIITIYLNGNILRENLKLTNKKQSFPVILNPGSNLFEVEAKNEGSIPPNTASVRISHVTKGRGTQIYERKSGQKASMKLYAP